jgi:putative oxidoreductase
MAMPVAISEFVGGLLLVGGVYTRWVALGLFPILLVATLKAHGANGWLFTNKGGGWEFSAFFAVATVVQFLLGDGADRFDLESQTRLVDGWLVLLQF